MEDRKCEAVTLGNRSGDRCGVMNVRVKYDVRVMNVRVKYDVRVMNVRVNDAFFRSKSGYSNLVDY